MQSPSEQVKSLAFFDEIGILAQLVAARLRKVLPDGVHPSHFAVLDQMVRQGDGKTPAELALAFQVTRATMSHTLALLERRGFVRLAVNADDGRSKHVHLTDHGRAFRDRAIVAVEALVREVVDAQTKYHMTAALPHLRAIRQRLDENR